MRSHGGPKLMMTDRDKPSAGPELADVARYAAASDPSCQQCGAMCDAEEIVDGQLWCYCQSCEMETFHPLMKPHNAEVSHGDRGRNPDSNQTHKQP